MAGGPQSPAGKQRSRQNALKHGLSAQTLVSEILGRGRLAEAMRGFQAEWMAEATGLKRPGTLRKLRKTIQAARDSPAASLRLAGLDRYFHPTPVSHPGPHAGNRCPIP